MKIKHLPPKNIFVKLRARFTVYGPLLHKLYKSYLLFIATKTLLLRFTTVT